MRLFSTRQRQPGQASPTAWRLRHLIFPLLVGMLIILLETLTPLHANAAMQGSNTTEQSATTPGSIKDLQQALKKKIHVTHHQTKKQQKTQTITPKALNLPAYNNVGTADDSNGFSGNFDHQGSSYSTQALQAAGIVPGQNFIYDTITYTWPSATAGTANNYEANGQVIPVLQIANAAKLGFLGAASNGAASGSATITYTDGTTQTITLGFTDWAIGTVSFGNTIAATTTYRNTQDGKQTKNIYLFSAEFPITAGKTVQSVTLPTTVTGGQLHVFAVGVSWPAPNNTGTSDDSNRTAANVDGQGNSYSAQALQSAGVVPGRQVVMRDGIAYTWPSAAPGTANNYQASGQTLYVEPVPNATTLGFLGAATNGAGSGTATMTYTDGSTQTVTLGFTDWTTGTLSFGNTVATTMSYRNRSSGQQTIPTYLFNAEVALQSGKVLQSVTLPTTVTGGQLHVFAVGTASSLLNNIGVSDDGNALAANYDGSGRSYSLQSLQTAGITPGKNFLFNGVSFPWPTELQPDNTIAAGQTLPIAPVTNTTALAFLGSATNGTTAGSAGTATITYTDATTSTFQLGFTDWWVSTPNYNNIPAATFSSINTTTGPRPGTYYLFYTETTIPAGKTIQSVTLPTTVSNGQLHVFAVGTRSNYNNIGISDDTNPSGANFDLSGNSYSVQDFSDPNGPGWNPGDTLTYEGIDYTWPNVPAGQGDNYVAQGQTIPITAVPGATTIGFVGSADHAHPSSSGTVTLTYTDNTTSTVTLGMTDWVLNGGSGTPLANNHLFAILPHRNTPQGQAALNSYLYEMEANLTPGKTLKSITLPSSVDQGHLHIFMIGTRANNNYPNNIGTSDDSSTTFASFDTTNHSYSIQALEAARIYAGQNLTFNGVTYTWPASYSVIPDNYLAAGQTIGVTPVGGATTLAFLGAATNGPSSGTATITYQDATTQTFTLGMSDWTLNAGAQSPSFGNAIVTAMPYRNTITGQENTRTYIFSAEVALTAGKTIQSVTLPTSVNQGQLHIFAVGTRAGAASGSSYNNVGTSDDSAPSFGNFDAQGNSYSAQALQQVGLIPSQNVTVNGVTFIWPNMAPGYFNNYQAAGQTIGVTPIDGATTLAFLGSASNKGSSGTATITYTDGSTQTFTLGFTDWVTSTLSYGNSIAATMSYHNASTGKQTGNTYIFYTSVTLQAGKTIQSVTLPATFTGGQPHVFAIGTK
ncbi:beta strand repeat-containing protein [Ktedonospora formicarum]|uniref:Uncharacterized protein n=1 Tax=Ktedonospora formicarum TaxID=2778364 RepID=A0A8J3I4R3_9CHLR|nr:hypothetical protein [Ktedonospora formicarum]GHO48681.1 hypothetical protein KSX_68440 [Ktedonospora formicarum]